MKLRLKLTALLLLCTSTSCSIFGPDFSSDELIRFEAPAKYALWWKAVETCSRRTGDFSKMRFYRSRSNELHFDGKSVGGFWTSDGNRIALLNPDDGPAARHEMLHALLNIKGKHDPNYFAVLCGGYVQFEGAEQYGIPANASSAARADATTALHVSVSTIPGEPSVALNDGAVLYVVTAENVRPVGVWLILQSKFLGGIYFPDIPDGRGVFATSDSVFFAAGQKRQLVIDGKLDSAGPIRVRAHYAGADSPIVTLSVRTSGNR